MDISKCGYLDASMNYSDTEGRAKIATLRFEKISRFSQNQDKTTNMKGLKILFITSIICSALNCIMGVVDGNWSAAAGWFVAAYAGLLLSMDYLKLKQ